MPTAYLANYCSIAKTLVMHQLCIIRDCVTCINHCDKHIWFTIVSYPAKFFHDHECWVCKLLAVYPIANSSISLNLYFWGQRQFPLLIRRYCVNIKSYQARCWHGNIVSTSQFKYIQRRRQWELLQFDVITYHMYINWEGSSYIQANEHPYKVALQASHTLVPSGNEYD